MSRAQLNAATLRSFRVEDLDTVYYVPDYIAETEERSFTDQILARPYPSFTGLQLRAGAFES